MFWSYLSLYHSRRFLNVPDGYWTSPERYLNVLKRLQAFLNLSKHDPQNLQTFKLLWNTIMFSVTNYLTTYLEGHTGHFIRNTTIIIPPIPHTHTLQPISHHLELRVIRFGSRDWGGHWCVLLSHRNRIYFFWEALQMYNNATAHWFKNRTGFISISDTYAFFISSGLEFLCTPNIW